MINWHRVSFNSYLVFEQLLIFFLSLLEISESKRSSTCCKLWSILCGLYHLIYFIAGIVILGFGIYLKLKIPKFLTFSDLKIKNLEEYVLDFSIITICIGAIVMTIAFFGCYGSMTKNVCMVRTYAALVILILISMICGTIVIFIHKASTMCVYVNNCK